MNNDDITAETPTEEPVEQPTEEEEEEEEHYEDNTQYRDDILQTQPTTYDEWITYINNLEINTPDIPDVDFTDENDIFAHIPVIIDACKYIYNTRNYRFESYAKAANELYTTYKQSYEDIQSKYTGLFNDIDNKYIGLINKVNSDITLTDDVKQQQLTQIEQQKQNDINETTANKEDEVLTLNTDYMNKCYAIVQKVNEIKQQTTTETGFIGDVYIEGKLNNHPVSEYVLRSELTTGDDGNIAVDLEDYVKRDELNNYSLATHTHDEYIKKANINELFREYEFYLFKMEDKLNIKLDKSTFGYSDDETVINKLYYYNHKCDTLTEQSNSIAVELLPLVNDDQMYFIYGYLYVKNYWNSEVVYKIECKAINSTVEVNTVDIIRSNGTNWTPLEGLHKITLAVGDKAYVGVIVNSEDAYNWCVYFSGYYNDVNICKIVKENEYVDVSVYDVLNYVSIKDELTDKITTEANTINETITTIKDELDNKITTEANTINEQLDTKADVGHTHSTFGKIHSSVNIGGKTSNLDFDGTAINWHVIGTSFEYSIDADGIKYNNGSLNIQSNSCNLMIDGNVEIKGNKVLTEADNVLTKSQLIDLFYPVGSIYTSMNSTSPKYMFGGEWTQIVDKFLYCSNSSEQVGGSKTITVDNLPAHGHNVSANTSSDGAHTHSVSANTSSAGSHSHTYSGNTGSSGNHSHTFAGTKIEGEFGQDAYIGYFDDTVVDGVFSLGTKNMPNAFDASRTNATTSRMKFSATPSGTISTTGAHTHSYKGSTSETVAHIHSIDTTTRSNGSHTHSVSGVTDLVGSGTDYMPPYMTVYAWYRTA